MNPVEYHLKYVIYQWCGVKPDQYTVDSQLRDIWGGRIPTPAYEPDGIHRLMGCMYADVLFGPCPSAHAILPGEFFKGGDLQTVRSLYIRLLPCGANAPIDPNAGASF